MKNLLLIGVIVVMQINHGYAQKDYFTEGEIAFNNEKFHTAIESFKKAESKEKKVQKKAKINYRIGLCYENIQEVEQAETYYKRSMKLKYAANEPILHYRLAMVFMEQEMYQEARNELLSYLSENPADTLAARKLQSCEAAMNWKINAGNQVIMQEYQLNTPYYDWSVAWGDKRKNSVLFASTRPGSEGDEIDGHNGQSFSDIWLTTRDNNGKWSEPQLLPESINTKDNEGTPVMNQKMNKLYFTRCVREKKQNVGCAIYNADKQGNKWATAQEIQLKPEGADSISVGHPTLSKDEQVLIFSSDLPGGFGGKDLWYSLYDKRNKEWSKPVNLGSEINTNGNELFPHLEGDELYFSSDGRVGMGGLDLYKAIKMASHEWSQVENLGFPVNSAKDDYGIIFDNDEKTRGMLTSNRKGGKGKDDLYSFYLPELIFELECIVTDKLSGEPIPNTKIELIGDDGSIYTEFTDEDGHFVFDMHEEDRYLKMDRNYILQINKKDYGTAKTTFSTIGLDVSRRFIEEFYMFMKDTAYPLPEVRYDYNDSVLQVMEGKVNSKDSLDYLYNLMIENSNWVVELQAHTDCRGTIEYNDALSTARANECVRYLVSKGIATDRLVPKGYGERQPKKGLECTTIEEMKTKEEQEAAHQKNRRTEFKILSFDYR